MSLFLKLQAPDFSEYRIDYKSKLLFMGSCFSENIYSRLHKLKFDTISNPYGILFDPMSIKTAIQRIASGQDIEDKYIFNRKGIYYSWLHHSEYSSDDRNLLIDKINMSNKVASEYLRNSSHIFITLGTSFYFHLKEYDINVANCHKVDGSKFEKRLLSYSENQKILEEIINEIHQINPNATICFTVSPVRHIKNGIVENSRSKSNLISSVQDIVDKYNYCIYFPSFEYFIDIFRDYRFFKEDMIHPNEQAIDLVFEEFKSSFFSNDTIKIIEHISSINSAYNHKILYPKSEDVIAFKAKILEKIVSLKESNPELDFSVEEEYFRN